MRPVSLLLALVFLVACDPTQFSTFADEAPTLVVDAPAVFESSGVFGLSLGGYDGPGPGGAAESRLVVSGGPGTPYSVFRIWAGGAIDFDGSLDDGCDSVGDCDRSSGAQVGGFASTGGGERLCAIVTAPETGAVIVNCESAGNDGVMLRANAGERAGESLVTLSSGRVSAVLGAPGAAGGEGGIYVLVDGEVLSPVTLPMEALGGAVGTAVAAMPITNGVFVALGSPVGSRVALVELTVTMDGAVSASFVANLTAPSATGFGGVVVAGDFNADNEPDVAVASSPAATGRDETVQVWLGPDFTQSPMVARCSEQAGIGCEGARFGAAMKVADVNGDAHSDLLIGAPLARVGDVADAGALITVPGSPTGLDLTGLSIRTHSSPGEGDRFAEAIAAVRVTLETTPRAEAVVAIPGRDQVGVVLCSGIVGDRPDVGPRCLP